ncbi:amino acid oxidase [Mangrovactinospora gilvigrisea]|uniref:D-amino-acid oxidase n=1 Tax=Mangrovactinospora gilvigrisea TaxID=1428644 RepID=A0A1J7BEE6_9ACTN|nr:FAD-dependent oxidoreductase [Mangrovactinospora gilvigrisea]OIV36949.1 amino acid oxidase [Mangrovactinospora gilvigrisea]
MSPSRVIVLGAGVIGLTTAVVLAEAGRPVTVVAAKFPGATSAAAGASWGPYLVEPADQVARWSSHSLAVFTDLATAAPGSGVRLASGTDASRGVSTAPAWARTLPGFRPLRTEELPAGFARGHRYTTPLIDMPRYLRYLAKRAADAGAVLVRDTVSGLADPAAQAESIVNCTGMGARTLADDPTVRPIRGQHVVVANPGLIDFFEEDTGTSPDLLCIYPHRDTVVLGGTAIDGSADTAGDPAAAKAILERCIAVEPRLAGAPILEHRIGLRPTRPTVRVEREGKIVHNYGHGGAGVTLSWGCAEHVRALLQT